MDKQLEEYRKRKQREQLIAKTKNSFAGLPSRLYNGLGFSRFGLQAVNRHQNNSNLGDGSEPLLSTEKLSDNEDDVVIEHKVLSDIEIDNINCCTSATILKYAVIFVIWALLYALFIQWGFGMVYFGISALIGMYLNTGTRRKQKGEMSAYSVFNKDCKSIHGTVKAEDLEKQMIYGRLF